MNRTIGIISYVLSIILFGYLLLANGWGLYWYHLGGHILVWHPLFPNTYDEFTFIPLILTEIYIFLTSFYFIVIGWRKIKATAPNSHTTKEKTSMKN